MCCLSSRPPASASAGPFLLNSNQLAGSGSDTRTRQPWRGVVHRSGASLLDEGPQLGKVPTAIVEIGEDIAPQNGFAGPVPSAPRGAAKRRPKPGKVRAILVTLAPVTPVGKHI